MHTRARTHFGTVGLATNQRNGKTERERKSASCECLHASRKCQAIERKVESAEKERKGGKKIVFRQMPSAVKSANLSLLSSRWYDFHCIKKNICICISICAHSVICKRFNVDRTIYFSIAAAQKKNALFLTLTNIYSPCSINRAAPNRFIAMSALPSSSPLSSFIFSFFAFLLLSSVLYAY